MAKLPIEFEIKNNQMTLKRLSPKIKKQFDNASIEELPDLFKQVATRTLKKQFSKPTKDLIEKRSKLFEIGYFQLVPERLAAYNQLKRPDS